MNKIIAIAIVAFLSAAAVPAVDAGEVKNADYDIPSGPTGNYGLALSTRLCAEEWDNMDQGVLVDPVDDPIGELLTPVSTAGCSTFRSVWAEDGLKMGVYSEGIRADVDGYTDFLISITDTLPADAYFLFCILTDYQDGRGGKDTSCGGSTDDIEDPRVAACGSAGLSSPLPAGGDINRPSTFVYATYVDETSGGTCFASKGTLTVDMA